MDSAEEPNRESVVHRAEHFVAENWQPWLEKSEPEFRLPVSLAIAAAMVLVLVLIRLNPQKLENESKPIRRMSWILTLAIVLGNIVSAVALDYMILFHDVKDEARVLFGGGASVFVTNVIAFGLLYWEFDRGGPFARRLRPKDSPHRFPVPTDGAARPR